MNRLFNLGLLIISFNSYAVSFQDVETIYQTIIKRSGFTGAPSVRITDSKTITAGYRSFDNSIMVTKASADLMNKSEMAFVLLHELGHWSMQTGGDWDSEMDADKWALVKGKKIGYNMCKGAKILKIFDQDSQHPSGIMRYNTIKCKD